MSEINMGRSHVLRNLLIVILLLFILFLVLYLIFTFYIPVNKTPDQYSAEWDSSSLPEVVTELKWGDLTREKFYALETNPAYEAWEFAQQQAALPTQSDNPLAPMDISIQNPKTGKRLLIFWQIPAGINAGMINIYRSDNGSDAGELIKQVPLETDYYIDENINDNQTYYYKLSTQVTTVDGVKKESEFSGFYMGVSTDVTPPSLPVNFIVQDTGAGGALKLAWDNPLENDFKEIQIYRSTQAGEIGTLIKTTTENTYLDTGLINGQTYYYTLSAVDNSGNISSLNLATTIAGNSEPFILLEQE